MEMNVDALTRDRWLNLQPFPGKIPPNLEPVARCEHLERHDSWARASEQRLEQVSGQFRKGMGAGAALAAAGIGLTAAAKLAPLPETALLVGVTMGVCGVFGALGAGALKWLVDRHASGVGDYARKTATALQRAREGLEQLAEQERARQAEMIQGVRRLADPPRTGLAQERGYLVMPGVRLRVSPSGSAKGTPACPERPRG